MNDERERLEAAPETGRVQQINALTDADKTASAKFISPTARGWDEAVAVMLHEDRQTANDLAIAFARHRLAAEAAIRAETAGEIARLLEALRIAHNKLHECTAVLSANDCADVAKTMAFLRLALADSTTEGEG